MRVKEAKMEIHELIVEMKLLERRLTLYEEKYGVLSENFYASLMAGELSQYDAYDETRADKITYQLQPLFRGEKKIIAYFSF